MDGLPRCHFWTTWSFFRSKPRVIHDPGSNLAQDRHLSFHDQHHQPERHPGAMGPSTKPVRMGLYQSSIMSKCGKDGPKPGKQTGNGKPSGMRCCPYALGVYLSRLIALSIGLNSNKGRRSQRRCEVVRLRTMRGDTQILHWCVRREPTKRQAVECQHGDRKVGGRAGSHRSATTP